MIFIFSNNAVFADNINPTDSFLQKCNDNILSIPTLKSASVNSSSPKLGILVMQPNSVAIICMKYVKLSHGSSSFETNNTRLIPSIGIEDVQVHGSQVSFGTIPVNNVVAKAQQKIISFGSQENASTVISYTLSAKPDSIGYYHVGIPYMCGNILLAVGYQVSQIDASSFQDVNPMCFNYGVETSIVGIQGANMTYVDISNKTIHSTKLPENISIIPPLQQMRIYDDVRFIRCNPDLQLIFKSENGSPACVKPETAQKLIERGWAKEITGSTTQQASIIQDMSTNVCGQFYIAPDNPPNLRETPALLMGLNSTACAKFTFTVVGNFKDCNGPHCSSLARLDSLVHMTNIHYEKNDYVTSVTPAKDFTNSFKIKALPEIVDLSNYSLGSKFTVTYIIEPLLNATGFYDTSIPKIVCDSYPLAVGHVADEVNASDFTYINSASLPCPGGLYQLTGIEISGMNYTEMKLP